MRKTALRRKTPLPRPSKPLKRGRVKRVNAPRRTSNWARSYGSSYGSMERVRWVKSQPCIICGETPSENAHVGRKGAGAGRKADADQIAPLCATHHAGYHKFGKATMELAYQISFSVAAFETEAKWAQHVNQG